MAAKPGLDRSVSDGVRVSRPRLESDGHALETMSADATTQTIEVSGGYGQRFSTLSSGTWPIDGFHGSDPDGGLSHMGARHLRLGDGLWLQPEPLLYLGMTNGEIDKPLFYGGVYAAGRPWGLEDRSGYYPGDGVVEHWSEPQDVKQAGAEGNWAAVQLFGEIGAGMSPAGPAIDAADLKAASDAGDTTGMALAGIGFLPVAGDALKGLGKAVRKVGSKGGSLGAMKGAFGVASDGGKHSGFLKQAEGMTSGQRGRASKSLQGQIEAHEAKIADPASHVEGWASKDPREQAGLIKHWEKEITNFSEQQQILDSLE